MKQELRVLVGPIGCGKSTYARTLADQGFVVVNDDAIVSALGGGPVVWRPALERLYKGVETSVITLALTSGYSIVVDRPCHRRETRERYVNLAHAFDAKSVAVVFPRRSPEENAERRFRDNPRGCPLEKWQRVAAFHESVYEAVDQQSERFNAIIILPGNGGNEKEAA